MPSDEVSVGMGSSITDVDVLRYRSRPTLRRPVLIAAFRGWNDAADAASSAAAYLRKAFGSKMFCSVDPEEFFDFQVNRPQVTLEDGVTRKVDWPATEFSYGPLPGSDRDAVVLTGVEPSMRWRTFCDAILEVAGSTNVEMVLTLGALLAEVPHSRPVRVLGTAADPEIVRRLGLTTSRYEGPSGIVGVLHDACLAASLPSVALWASVPHYISNHPSPKAALELVRRAQNLVGFEVETSDLEEETRGYEEKVSAAVESDPEVADLVRQLEERDDADPIDLPSGDDIAQEFERFLKDLDSPEGE